MKSFTPRQVAKICKVAPRTVNKWLDSGRIRSDRVLGTQDRRINRGELVRFLTSHGMPLGEMVPETVARVLVITEKQSLYNELKAAMADSELFEIGSAANTFEAGIIARSLLPHVLVIDFTSVPELTAHVFKWGIQTTNCLDMAKRIGLLPGDLDEKGEASFKLDFVLKDPVDPALVAATVREQFEAVMQ